MKEVKEHLKKMTNLELLKFTRLLDDMKSAFSEQEVIGIARLLRVELIERRERGI